MSFTFRIDPKPGYLLVWQKGCPSVEEVVPLQHALDQASLQHDMRCVILDTRQLTPPGETVRNFMVDWLDRHPRLSIQALVMHSDLLAVRASMDALAKGIARRGFRTIGQAEAWIIAKSNKK